MPKELKEGETLVEIHTILSHRTKEGKVNFAIQKGDERTETQWDVAKAKHICNMLHEAIEAAISDELIYKFFTQKIGFSDEKASMVLLDFRNLRQGSFEFVDPN